MFWIGEKMNWVIVNIVFSMFIYYVVLVVLLLISCFIRCGSIGMMMLNVSMFSSMVMKMKVSVVWWGVWWGVKVFWGLMGVKCV